MTESKPAGNPSSTAGRPGPPAGTSVAPRIGGVPADSLLGAQVPALARRMVATFADRFPTYSALPREELAGDITRVVEDNLRAFVRTLRTGRLPSRGDLVEMTRSSARRAEEGVPLGAVLSAYHLGWRMGLDALVARAGPADLDAVVEVERILLDVLQLVSAAVADAYVEEHQALHGQDQAARHEVLSALLDGQDPREAARRAGVRPAPAYAVLTLALGAHPDETDSGVSSSVAARRKLRRIQAEIDHHGRDRALHALNAHGGTALLPVDDPETALTGGWERLTGLVARIADRAGTAVHAGVAATAAASVADAARESADILEIVRITGREPGAYRITDVLLDYQLSRPGPARTRLAGLLAVLDDHPVLLETLRAYVASAFSRRRAAPLLHVHPNTVDYRLRRVAVLTGLDPTCPGDLPRLRAALVAHDFTPS
ncbi:PucR family transcriptional regulator [Actinomadura harenae]|nr:helix-turn-helix domain-containing protein [Actinomadura harenae]